MKLLSFEMSRITSLFRFMRKAGQLFLPEASIMLSNRYSFSKSPSSYEELVADKIEFTHGKFEGAAIENLEIFNDGVIASSRSDTDILDGFLADLKDWIVKDLEMSLVETHTINTIYESNFVFESPKDILKPLQSFHEIAALIDSDLKRTSNLEVSFVPFGWGLAADQTVNPHLKPTAFRLERRIGIEFSRNHYIAVAPLKTKQHISIIKKIESLV